MNRQDLIEAMARAIEACDKDAPDREGIDLGAYRRAMAALSAIEAEGYWIAPKEVSEEMCESIRALEHLYHENFAPADELWDAFKESAALRSRSPDKEGTEPK